MEEEPLQLLSDERWIVQAVRIQTYGPTEIPEGWEPFAYDHVTYNLLCRARVYSEEGV